MNAPAQLGIEAADYVLPRTRYGAEQWGQLFDKPDLVERLHANGARFFYREHERDIVTLAGDAVARLVERHQIDVSQVDLIIHFHTLQASVPPDSESLPESIRRKFGLKRATCFSLAQQNCVSFAASIRIFRAMLERHPQLQSCLLIGSDKLPNDLYRTIEDVGLQSDGACAALLVRNGQRNRVLGIAMHTSAQYHAGAGDPQMVRELNREYYMLTQRVIRRAATEAGRPLDQFRLLLPHNVNHRGWTATAGFLRRPVDWIFTDNIASKGHVFGCDGLINLTDAKAAGRIQDGDPYLMYSMGFGGCFGAIAFEA
jgi:3-oxoacyl-[acyl-carrier-protein] synthase III